MKWGYLLFGFMIIVEAFAQLFEKRGMNQVVSTHIGNSLWSWDTIVRTATNPFVLGGLALSGLGFLLWLTLLSQFKVSYIFPLSSILYIIVTVFAFFWLGEHMTAMKLAGIGVIITGCIMINL